VALRLSLDTAVLIDLQRERLREPDFGPAHRFLKRVPQAELCLSVTALGEFAEGFASSEDPNVRLVRDRHALLLVDQETALLYAGIARDLRARGRLIGVNDLWIAATSLRHGLPLVTSNVDHFRRVPGLEVIDYRKS
jgi:tRNA(fMet)-specific endonuclease VapC